MGASKEEYEGCSVT